MLKTISCIIRILDRMCAANASNILKGVVLTWPVIIKFVNKSNLLGYQLKFNIFNLEGHVGLKLPQNKL